MDDNPYQAPADVESVVRSPPKNRLLAGLACLTVALLVAAGGLLLLMVLFVVALSFSDM